MVTLFVVLGVLATAGRTLALDQAVMWWLHQFSSPALTLAMLGATWLGSLLIVGPVGVIAAAYLDRRGRRSAAVVLLLAIGTEQILDFLTKLAYARPRPELWPHLAPAVGYSYPSGHTLLATVAYGLGALLLVRLTFIGRYRVLTCGVAVALVVIVALSRVYLGVHYPTDVIGGALLGLGWICLWLGVLTIRSPLPVGEG